MITQVYLYFAAYKQDKLVVKLFILLLFLCDILNTVFDFVYLYDCFVLHFSEVAYLTKVTWVFSTDPPMTGIIAGLVQLFFAWRILVLTSNVYLCGIVVLLALLGIAGGLATAAECGIISQSVQFQRYRDVVTIWLGSARSCDVVITFLLGKHPLLARESISTLVMDREDKKLDSSIQITWLTGSFGPTGIHLIFNMPLSKVYTNSLMSSLSSRQESTTSAPNLLSSANTTAYKHTQYSFARPSQEEEHNTSALNSQARPQFPQGVSSTLLIGRVAAGHARLEDSWRDVVAHFGTQSRNREQINSQDDATQSVMTESDLEVSPERITSRVSE
ncbi:uncharacterized protein EV420DRAFT_1633476 [Desarmillaria tabescens]|uniref:Transmembrane protein n=1 Tax=Armillaria tabescens TaxID=1929756 RepID=A0AA39NNY0_ARMTA|nr:uncharacterized protein EV420DRAFT_1633476 [Desarmillaria tabescens]KAK0469040.1 hypothetical protein EV420DRAFT_1633476 [Desarmillaria tabescens]